MACGNCCTPDAVCHMRRRRGGKEGEQRGADSQYGRKRCRKTAFFSFKKKRKKGGGLTIWPETLSEYPSAAGLDTCDCVKRDLFSVKRDLISVTRDLIGVQLLD
jgi:hypothetical protein